MRDAVRRSLRFPGTVPFLALFTALPTLATGWSWMNPSPTGAFVYSITRSASGDDFVFAADGTAGRKTTAGWQPLFCERAIDAVRAVGSRDGAVFAAGTEVGGNAAILLRWNGSFFDAVAEAPFRVLDLWASSEREAWMGGVDTGSGEAVVFRWDGSTLTRMVVVRDPNLAVRFLWGSSSSDVWAAVTGDGLQQLHHWDGRSWSEESLGGGPDDARDLAGLHGSGPQRPLLVAVHDDDHTPVARVWQKESSGWLLVKEVYALSPVAVAGTPDGTVAVSGWGGEFRVRVVVGRGGSWSEEEPGVGQMLTTLSGTLGNGFLAVGAYDSTFERTASGWTELVPRSMDNFEGIARRPDGSLLLWGGHVITGEGLLVRRETDGRMRTVVSEPAAPFINLRTGPDGVLWAVGSSAKGKYGVVYRSVDGIAWTKDFQTVPGELLLRDVLPAYGTVRVVGIEAEPQGPLGAAPMHLLRRAADGTWAEEFATELPLLNSRFAGGASSPTLLAFDPTLSTEGIGRTLVFVNDASGWSQKAAAWGITMSKDVDAGGGRVLVLGLENATSTGVVGAWDGAALEVLARAKDAGGLVLLFDLASVGAQGYLLPGWTRSAGNVLFGWDGVSREVTVASRTPAAFNAIAAVSPTEIWLAGYLGRLFRFDGGGDLRAGRVPDVTVTQARHRPTVASDLVGWYGIPANRATSDVMDAVATVPAGRWAELEFTWVPDRSIPVSQLRLLTVDEGRSARMLHLAPGARPMPDGGFELLDPSGRSLEKTATLVPGAAFTVRYTVRDGSPGSRHDLDPRPGIVRTSVVLTTF